MENLVFEDSFKKELDEIISGTLEPKKTKTDILRIKKILNAIIHTGDNNEKQ